MPQFIYTMKGLGKVHPPDIRVLDEIWLSFLPGAKIGVLGANGAGKSSLLRIMAGEDATFLGEAFPAAGISVGFLPQEPRLDAAKSVVGNLEEGVAALKALLAQYVAEAAPGVGPLGVLFQRLVEHLGCLRPILLDRAELSPGHEHVDRRPPSLDGRRRVRVRVGIGGTRGNAQHAREKHESAPHAGVLARIAGAFQAAGRARRAMLSIAPCRRTRP